MKQPAMETVFDFAANSDATFEIFKSAMLVSTVVLFIGLACLCVVIVKRIRKREKQRWVYSNLAFYLTSIGLILFLISTPVAIIEHSQLKDFRNVIKNKRYHVVEGIVHVEHEQPESGHAKGDVITINDTKLEVDYFVMTRAYKETIAHGGVLKEGVYTRLYVYDGMILRVDVREEEK